MKKIIFAILLCSSAIASAQRNKSTTVPSAIIKFTPQHMFRGGLWLGAEFLGEKKKTSNQLSAEFLYNKPVGKKTGYYETQGFTVEYMFRYYPSRLHVDKTLTREKVSGFYTGIFAQAGKYDQKTRRYDYKGFGQNNEVLNSVSNTTFYPGFIVGRTMSLGESIYLDVYFGAGMHISNSSLKNEDPEHIMDNYYFLYNNGVLPKIGFSLGVGI